jgi:hypothetical protein
MTEKASCFIPACEDAVAHEVGYFGESGEFFVRVCQPHLEMATGQMARTKPMMFSGGEVSVRTFNPLLFA